MEISIVNCLDELHLPIELAVYTLKLNTSANLETGSKIAKLI